MLLRWARTPIGVGLGVLSAGAELLFLTAAIARRPGTRQVADRIARWELRRLTAAGATDLPHRPEQPPWRYLAARVGVGALGLAALVPLVIGVYLVAIVVRSVVAARISPVELATLIVIGVALLLLNLQLIASVGALDARLARRLLGPTPTELLRRRVDELATSRAGVMAAVDAERRRIERDLHDGLQQQLVALGMLLGRARRAADPAKAQDLVRQAHDDAQHSLAELRAVAWRVYPSALDSAGLDEVLDAVASRSGVPVTITCDLPVRPPRQVETVAYFVVCEAMTNAAKHADASRVDIRIWRCDERLALRVHDDGHGGADPTGSGLSGLAGRVAALDGTFRITSPLGGPTILEAELPCGS